MNAIKLVDISKQRLQVMRDDGWNSLLEEVSAFCAKNNIDVPDMDDFISTLAMTKSSKHEKFTSLSSGAFLYCYRYATTGT